MGKSQLGYSMKIGEILSFKFSSINELYINLDHGLGFTKLGQGVDQTAWLNPTTGLVWKVFADLSHRGEVLLRFAEFCKARPTNPMLPDFYTIHRSELKDGTPFGIAITERLFPIEDPIWRRALSNIATYIRDRHETTSYDDILNAILWQVQLDSKTALIQGSEYAEVLSHIAIPSHDIHDTVRLFITTIIELAKLSDSLGFTFDLHGDNFMFGSDGTIVINDPWVYRG